MSMQYIVYTHNLQNITETDHEKEYKLSNSALAEWFMANTDNPPTTASILKNAVLNYLLQFQ